MTIIGDIRDRVSALPRGLKQILIIGFDTLALLGVLWLSFSVRLGAQFTPQPAHILLMLLAPVVAIPVFVRLGLYRAVIRYLPERALWTIIQAMALATILWVFCLFVAEATRLAVFPRTVPFLYFVLGALVIAGSRFAAKHFLWLPERALGQQAGVVIYGAGAAGSQLAEALRSQRRNYVAAFIDDDRNLWGRDLGGVRVHAPDRLEELVRNRGIREVILSIPSADATRRAAIVAELSRLPVKIRALPAISDLVSGKYLVNQLREIDIDDLLGRPGVPADPGLMQQMLEGKVILVTGAGGSIGSELTRLIVRRQPKKLVLLEANEFALYEIERKLKAMAEVEIVPVLGRVGDAELVRRTIADHAIEVIFHAAAHKHVPLLEANVLEGVRNNVLGTRTLVEAAVAAGVPRFVLISTDKAVRPSSVMGATKRWAELIVRHYGRSRAGEAVDRRYCAVRFGNVLGSNGSVVPLFREQIAAGGPVTLTDSRMTRYFMSIHEAAELIVQAGALAEGGDIFLLDMGQPVAIRELAADMIRLAGLTVKDAANPGGDIAIVETGARPGEKLEEELFFDPANALPTTQPRILRSPPGSRSPDGIEAALQDLELALDAGDAEAARRVLFGFVEKRD
jgi:FlaA1/EpsC-like NDP-sugar epimerase